jgi:hypothetical protein
MTIEELFGTLQMSVVAGWRKHLRSAKYGKHMALDEFYKEMPEKVDDLIEAYMGAYGKKIGAFQNILSSSNMNTLKYLQELKKVCKEGYDLLDDNEELEGLMDDVINLINSTLYKVKELSESKMIDLADFVNEALVMESNNDFMFAWTHYDPDTMYCLNGNINEIPKFLKDYDWQYQDAKISTKLCTVVWNDEYAYVTPVEGNNLNDAKRKDLKHIEDQINQQKDQIEQEQYMYIESDIFGSANEWNDDDVSTDATEIQKRFIDMIENSYVDGDSNSARAVIDIRKGQVLLQGLCYVSFMSANEFMEMVERGDE